MKAEKKLALWEAFDNDDGYECIVSGTVDVLIDTRDGYAAIIDWKFGRADISDVTSMLQLTGYAVLAFSEHEHIEAIEAYKKYKGDYTKIGNDIRKAIKNYAR